ncbi:uncharacterized protein M6B38_153880 [Iris pallida]|uniref:Uncharacterized protein n=1 Tax=Iris pallida TaxID=29817 RepID=A0AAX6F680_IRIPA|nr:uncharacterized protein M6B38_153880 [Iris pallida]
MQASGTAALPSINVNDSVTKSKAYRGHHPQWPIGSCGEGSCLGARLICCYFTTLQRDTALWTSRNG